ncbi:MarR family transcriptional regulator [Amycolatopsis rhabdoformis]|uniref:MarR family transcriptional regulator n=1 Tax=Amycolatopsis rhabdoformis TaxID=1448059 RepID=A0ABZ1I8B8_9PSEU|nr:MarR family transcriptional regulator [Amycolatopsis rhabdoformis]WSE29936.1 MarR family transcriptional regulator [Amycolatopsis rhabdoformis]
MSTPTCRVCDTPIVAPGTGRPPRYCSAACRQHAYRLRKSSPSPQPERRRPAVRAANPPAAVEKDVPHLTRQELLAWRGVLELQTAILPALERELREHTGLTLSEFDVLYQLWRTPELQCRMVDLARAVLVTPGGVTRIVARLEERGLVRRLTATGRQAVMTQLTAQGQRELDAAMDVHFQGVRRMFLRHLKAEDIERMMRLWAQIREATPPAPCDDTANPDTAAEARG